jgi:Na+/pantothenate symporter
VFADVLQSPLIIVGTVAVLGAIAWLVSGGSAVTTAAAFVPLAPQPTPWLFVAHVLAVNLAFVLVTEGHWFRLWLFNEEESKRQLPSTIVTASVWALLAAAGCFAATLTTQTGNAGVVDVIHAIANLNGLFAFLFWLAASAALFSTADAQIYSLLVVAAYQPHRGALSDRVDRPNQVFRISLLVAVGFGLVYFPVRHYQVPFETVVFAVTPLAANILPALVATAFRRKPPLFWSYASLVGYLSLTTAGFLRPQDGLVWTLAAAIVPFIVAAIIPFTRRRD